MKSNKKEKMLTLAGKRIANARRSNGLSQEGLLDRIYNERDVFIDRNTLSLIERGKIATNGYYLFVICSALGMTVEEAFV